MSFFSDLNSWAAQHETLIVYVGIPAAAAGVAFLLMRRVEVSIAKNAELRAKLERENRELERRLAKDLKLSEFRQARIDGLREDFSTFISLCSMDERDFNVDRKIEAEAVSARILSRLNPKTHNFTKLNEIFSSFSPSENVTPSTEERRKLGSAVSDLSRDVLSDEWDRLKSGLDGVERP